MSGRNLNLEVIVRLKDLLSSPLRGLRNALDGISKTARQIGLVSSAVAAISFMGPIKEAAAFQQQLLDIAGTQGLAGTAAFTAVAEMKTQFQDLARVVGISSHEIGGAAGQMIAAGLDRKLVDAAIGDIARATTAANSNINDMAGVATSLMQNLKVPASQLREAMDGLVVAGKAGSFELKDMAKYFPTLTGEVAKFGVTGREAVNFLGAALQIARKGTADPAEAANNLRNFLNKILQPQTVKSFKDMGVDIKAVMGNAVTQGIDPIEAVIQKISVLTKASGTDIEGMMKKAKANGLEGADALAAVREQLEQIHGAGKLGELFSDMQVTGFLIPMLANIDEYKQIKDEIAGATGATTDKDFQTQIKGMNRELEIFWENMRQISDEVGTAFGKWLPRINETLGMAIDTFREFNAQTDGMGSDILMMGGAAVIASMGIGALGFVIPALTAGISAMLSPLRLVTGLFGRFRSATRGIGGAADELERINTAATKASSIRTPSIWSTLFGLDNMIGLVNNIPSDPAEFEKFAQDNVKRAQGWNSWLENNVGSPRSWLGLDKVTNPVPEIDKLKVEELRTSLASITNDWPFGAQQDMREFIDVLNNNGTDAIRQATQIGEDMKTQLSIVASPDIQTGELQKALDIAKELSGVLRKINDIRVGIPSLPAAGNDNGPATVRGAASPIVPLPAVGASGSTPSQPVRMEGSMVIGLDPRLKIVNADSGVEGVTVRRGGQNTGRAVGRE